MDTPESMRAKLGAWNNGAGIDLKSWVACEGNFSLAIGYAAIFWPEFVEFDGYLLRAGFSEASLRGCASQEGISRQSVEWVMNHLHLADIQHFECEDLTKDKVILLGNVLKEMYQAKLQWQFPDRPCLVEFYRPEAEEDLTEYQLSFWQVGHQRREDE